MTSVFCSNEVTLGDSWMRAGHQKDQAMIRSLEFSAPPSWFSLEGKGAEKGVNDRSCLCEEDPIKSPNYRVRGSFRVDEHVEMLAEWDVSSAVLPTYPALCTSSPWMFICILYHILYKKPVNINTLFS